MSVNSVTPGLKAPLLSNQDCTWDDKSSNSDKMDNTYVDEPKIEENFSSLNQHSVNVVSSLDMSEIPERDNVSLVSINNSNELSHDRARFRPQETIPRLRWHVHRFVDNLLVRIFSLSLVVADFVVLILRLQYNNWKFDKSKDKSGYVFFSNFVIAFFLVELALRIFAVGPLEVIDGLVIILSAVFEFVVDFTRVVSFGRIIRFVIVIRFVTEHYKLRKAARLKISENKRRYRKDGFDLDLTYITDRIIAMSFPSTGVRAFYRNPIGEVARFFRTMHKGHFLIFNCCSERDYNHKKFSGCVSNCSIDDHNVPLLETMLDFCEKASAFLDQDPSNVIAVHCKGGKGRTGTMICALMLYRGKFDCAKDSLDYFAVRRTDLDVLKKYQGVQTPSQGRYVGYMEDIIKKYDKKLPPPVSRNISTIRVISLLVDQNNSNGARNLSFEVYCDNVLVYDFDAHQGIGTATVQTSYTSDSGIPFVEFDVGNLVVQGDVKLKFKGTGLPNRYENCPFYLWFNPLFYGDVSRLVFPREVIDNPHKPKMWKYYNKYFAIEIFFAGGADGFTSNA